MGKDNSTPVTQEERIMDALKALKKALKNKMTDEFEEGSVIRWKSADRATAWTEIS